MYLRPELPESDSTTLSHIKKAIENEQCELRNTILREVALFINTVETQKQDLALRIYYLISYLPSLQSGV